VAISKFDTENYTGVSSISAQGILAFSDDSLVNSIIAVHGLGGHPLKTWTEGENLWLRDFLPTSIPEARIFTFGYDSGIAFNKSVSNIGDYGRDLIESLRSVRRKESKDVRYRES
jgi:hypothetical protein